MGLGLRDRFQEIDALMIQTVQSLLILIIFLLIFGLETTFKILDMRIDIHPQRGYIFDEFLKCVAIDCRGSGAAC